MARSKLAFDPLGAISVKGERKLCCKRMGCCGQKNAVNTWWFNMSPQDVWSWKQWNMMIYGDRCKVKNFPISHHDRCLNSILIHMLPSRNSEVPSRWLGDDVFHSYFFTQNTLGMGREKMRSVSPVWLAHVFSQLGGEQPSTWKISVSHLTSCTICNQRLLRLKTSLEERPVFNFFCLIHTLLN